MLAMDLDRDTVKLYRRSSTFKLTEEIIYVLDNGGEFVTGDT